MKTETFLQSIGYNVISTLVERNIVKRGKWVKDFRSIIPGYVFFESVTEPDWNEIYKCKHIIYALHYSNNQKQLKGNDLKFVKWIKGNGGKIKVSKAMEIGRRIKIAEGPLKELEGKIVKINKK